MKERPNIAVENADFLDDLAAKPRWYKRQMIQSPEIGCRRHLYKYFTLEAGSADSIRNVRLIVVDSKIWLSAASSFNDPFDFRARVEFSRDARRLRKYFEKEARQMIGSHRGHRKARERAVADVMRRAAEDPDAAQGIFDQLRDSNGVCCFTTNPRNLLMWSHYGRSHTGVCLMFEVAADLGLFTLGRPVNYTSQFPRLTWPDDKERIVDDVLFHKEDIWRYEDEVRLVDEGGPNRAFAVHPKALTGIILGAACPSTTEELVRGMIVERSKRGLPEVHVYRAAPRRDAYGVRILKVDL